MNKYEKDFDGKNLGSNGFPICPKCGGLLSWDNDYDAQDLGYDFYGVVSALYCGGCGMHIEAENNGDEYVLLNTSTKNGRLVHTKYGKEHLT